VWKLKSRVRNIIFNLSLNLDEKKVSPYCHKTLEYKFYSPAPKLSNQSLIYTWYVVFFNWLFLDYKYKAPTPKSSNQSLVYTGYSVPIGCTCTKLIQSEPCMYTRHFFLIGWVQV
jgi:hypothetical protein